MKCEIYELDHFDACEFVVVLSRQDGALLLSRRYDRATWETQGGHVEPGETALQAAHRELYEESGALEYELTPLFDYSYGPGRGRVYAADVKRRGPLPQSEMVEVRAFGALPAELTYPEITPVLFEHAGMC